LTFDRDGHLRCRVTFPHGFQLLSFGGAFSLGVEDDANDVPRITVYGVQNTAFTQGS